MTITLNLSSYHTKQYLNLFGEKVYNNHPLFIYAENLFYAGMGQMIPDYQGGVYVGYQLSCEGIEIEKTGFIPLIKSDIRVSFESPYGVEANLSFRAASLCVWLFVVEQIANAIRCKETSTRLYNTLQDIKYCVNHAEGNLCDQDGIVLINREDLNSILYIID